MNSGGDDLRAVVVILIAACVCSGAVFGALWVARRLLG